MKDFTTNETLLAKLAFKKLCVKADCSVKHYQADNGWFSDNEFLAACNNLKGLGHNKFDVQTKTKITPVGKPLLNKDLEGKLHKKDWKYHTAIGMLTYLQDSTCPEISMATLQLA